MVNIEKFDLVNVSEIVAGDTILHTDGMLRTVCKKDIKTGFMGVTLFGDSYRLGTILVKRIQCRR